MKTPCPKAAEELERQSQSIKAQQPRAPFFAQAGREREEQRQVAERRPIEELPGKEPGADRATGKKGKGNHQGRTASHVEDRAKLEHAGHSQGVVQPHDQEHAGFLAHKKQMDRRVEDRILEVRQIGPAQSNVGVPQRETSLLERVEQELEIRLVENNVIVAFEDRGWCEEPQR
jgi:hypothetical protein